MIRREQDTEKHRQRMNKGIMSKEKVFRSYLDEQPRLPQEDSDMNSHVAANRDQKYVMVVSKDHHFVHDSQKFIARGAKKKVNHYSTSMQNFSSGQARSQSLLPPVPHFVVGYNSPTPSSKADENDTRQKKANRHKVTHIVLAPDSQTPLPANSAQVKNATTNLQRSPQLQPRQAEGRESGVQAAATTSGSHSKQAETRIKLLKTYKKSKLGGAAALQGNGTSTQQSMLFLIQEASLM